jgi:predicted dehydrogenase
METRRVFLRNTAITAAGISLAPSISGVLAGCAPSDRINVGLIGCNGMGFSDLSAFLEHPQVDCTALCDIDERVLNRRAADVEKKRGAKPANLYKDWRQVIDNKDINLVIVGTPDHWHCLQMVAACEAGKDVYCEKPLGRTIEECNLMIKAA